ncbi:MAG: ABC transporter permease [Bacteroidales bacterium]|nr:ABC transporter permease [Bacteroidales bacterium]
MITIFTVIRKEFLDLFRDKRTLISAILVPAIAFPIIIIGIVKLQVNLLEKEKAKQLKITLINAPGTFEEDIFAGENVKIFDLSLETAKQKIINDSLDAVLTFQNDFSSQISQLKSGEINLYYKSTNNTGYKRITKYLEYYKTKILNARLKKMSISNEIIEPLKISEIDIAPPKEQIGELLGGILPYMFIIFAFMGCMVPAFSLITGEKESGTMETLLTVPASRTKILFAKMITIALFGLTAAFVSILGMVAAMKFLPNIQGDLLSVIRDLVNPKFILMLIVMLIPLSFFFGGLLSAIVVRANSYKEAQSYVSPLMIVIIIPAMIALMPGVNLNWNTVWIPILNISLATKEIISETISLPMYFTIIFSLILIAVIALYASLKQFTKEGMVLK